MGGSALPAKVIVVVLAAGLVFGLLATPYRIGDASNYVLMADSLLHDRDLRYDRADLERAEALQFGDHPAGLMLVRAADGSYTYGKPVVYPLIALPFYAVFGPRGFLALNGLLLAALLLLGADLLAPLMGWRRGAAVAAAVYGFSVVPVYLHWIDPFLLLCVLIAAAIVAHRRGLPIVSGAAIGAAAVCRFAYLLFAAVPLLLLLRQGRLTAALRFGLGTVVVGLALSGLTMLSSGQWSAHTGERFYFEKQVPFQTADAVGEPFTRSGILERWQMPAAADVARGLVDFVVGRSGGVLLYFPTFFACLLWARRWDFEKRLWLAAVFGFALLLELVLPHHRLGGEHAIGNRFFVLLPIGLCFIDFVSARSWRMAASIALACLALPIVQAPVQYSRAPGATLLAWPHRLFPFEWALANHVAYPVKFTDLFALSENQYYWEPPGAVWTIGGTTADYVLVRPADQPPTVKLWSLLPEARIADGGVWQTLRFDGASHELTLAHPLAQFRDEYRDGRAYSVYRLEVATDAAVRASTVGSADDIRRLGVFVQPLP